VTSTSCGVRPLDLIVRASDGPPREFDSEDRSPGCSVLGRRSCRLVGGILHRHEDLGSIGSNLGDKQPPISEFYGVLKAIRSKPEVQDVLVRIYAYDDPSSWPYTDAVYIIPSVPPKKVEEWVTPLKPDEVYQEWMYGKPSAAAAFGRRASPSDSHRTARVRIGSLRLRAPVSRRGSAILRRTVMNNVG
jgi:hypothetical protein